MSAVAAERCAAISEPAPDEQDLDAVVTAAVKEYGMAELVKLTQAGKVLAPSKWGWTEGAK